MGIRMHCYIVSMVFHTVQENIKFKLLYSVFMILNTSLTESKMVKSLAETSG